MNQFNCPVPKDQQPTNEFIELSKSKIFTWPKSKKVFSIIVKIGGNYQKLAKIVNFGG